MPLIIGVDPGSASMVRKASPKAPGTLRTSPRVSEVSPSSLRVPRTVTSSTGVVATCANAARGITAAAMPMASAKRIPRQA
jgi:hypothetical protein